MKQDSVLFMCFFIYYTFYYITSKVICMGEIGIILFRTQSLSIKAV